jgi:hypothetical protein
VPMVLLASQALAKHMVTVGADKDHPIVIDSDSIQRGSDGLVNYTEYDDEYGPVDWAMDCQRRVIYLIKIDGKEVPTGRTNSLPIGPRNTAWKVELKYLCPNAR